MIATLATLAVVVLAATQTDTTLAVKPGTRLELNQFSGSIDVQTWAKNSVRVVAEHGSRVEIEIQNSDNSFQIEAQHYRGIPTSVEYRLTVPKWMALELSGVNTDVSVQNSGGEVHIETVQGDVTVSGGTKVVEATSVEGEVRIENASGRIEVSSVNGGVSIDRSSGAVLASSVNGEITMRAVESGDVEASTVNGGVLYEGSIRSEGSYRMSTHNGEVTFVIPEKASASVEVSTFSGEFLSDFPIQLDETRHGKRFSFKLGTGSARIELESFQGTIRLRRPGEIGGRSTEVFRYEPKSTKSKHKNSEEENEP